MSSTRDMKTIDSLAQLPSLKRLAVIINCGTKWVSTLAVASIRKAGELPILIIDCESRDGSFDHFTYIAKKYGIDFFWLGWPLRKHGLTLDRLFREAHAEQILLVDSDVELRDPALLAEVFHALDRDPDAYGAGFLHGPEWLGSEHGLPPQIGRYAARMWIPFVALRTAAIKGALEQSASFAQRREFLEIEGYPSISHWLATRFWIPGLRSIPKREALRSAEQPAFVEWDTGATMHDALLKLGYRFSVLPSERWPQAHHYHGVTRSGLIWKRRKLAQRLGLVTSANDTEQNAIINEVRQRLAEHYAITDGAGELGAL
jgi:hypothetical protein